MKYKNGWNVAKTKLACDLGCNRIIKKGDSFYYHSIARNKFECFECYEKSKKENQVRMQKLNKELSKLFTNQ